MNILSIDYDYFFDLRCSFEYPYMTNSYWIEEYITMQEDFPTNMKFNYDAFYALRDWLKVQSVPVYVSEDHSNVFHVLKSITSTYFNIVNIDQHHDLSKMSGFGIANVTCGDWVDAVTTLAKVDYTWVTNTASIQQYVTTDVNRYCNIVPRITDTHLRNLLTQTYDIVFLIQSYDYSPSHMQHRFLELVKSCNNPIVDDMFELRFETYIGEAKNLYNSDSDSSVELCSTETEFNHSKSDIRIKTYECPFSIWDGQNIDYDPDYLCKGSTISEISVDPYQSDL